VAKYKANRLVFHRPLLYFNWAFLHPTFLSLIERSFELVLECVTDVGQLSSFQAVEVIALLTFELRGPCRFHHL
jgi:hypothetical protein